ncbi:Uncharacterised protein [Bordetella pertussis]|nr:Uncharacterised protein [Bordetella pertussis]
MKSWDGPCASTSGGKAMEGWRSALAWDMEPLLVQERSIMKTRKPYTNDLIGLCTKPGVICHCRPYAYNPPHQALGR